MGGGKTTASINYINKASKDTKFLYITPYLTEVKRVIDSCKDRQFKQPEAYGNKLNGIKYLFEKGYNIVSTHALFKDFDEEIIDIAYNNNYVLIMDEVANVIESLPISKDDLKTILEKYANVDEDNTLRWVKQSYTGEFEKYKRLCDLGCVGIYNNKAILWLFPISTFRAFKEIYILTYLFDAQTQKYYFDYYGVQYNYLYVKGDSLDDYEFTNEKVEYKSVDFSKLIHICYDKKLNEIGDLNTALSKGWYTRNNNNMLIKRLKNNCYNFFRNHTKTKSQLNLWTTFKDWKDIISGKGYAKGFLSSNMRATNEYRDRVAVAYLVNKYFNPYIKNFFLVNNIAVDEDAFAVSEMLQFIWRSAIRDGNEIWIYIPSSRMRTLLERWINKEIKNN